ncbi:MAG: tetratricopeptide repeat protein [Kiritimatiellae bacterium]|nr:tetratricopeptide repeat protein [Kiritimatiellia bacterium]
MNRRIAKNVFVSVAFAAASAYAVSVGPGTHYATDAYPGFDSESGIVEPDQKSPGFFSWWSGPKMTTPADQLAWARELEANEKYGKARDAYEALVAEWPASAEAPVAQQAIADLLYGKTFDYIEAFEEYKYLLDFFSSRCDYDAIARRMYDTACEMRRAGKTVFFVPFANTTDVRRAFECVVLHAPGASYAPEALLTIAELREDEGLWEKAIEVYETLRNIHAGTPEAVLALGREAKARMKVLRDHEYNRARAMDTMGFLAMARKTNRDSALAADLDRWYAETSAHFEDEAFAAAKFYDSKTRTRRGAVSAYEKFLREYPASRHAGEARERLRELQTTPEVVK